MTLAVALLALALSAPVSAADQSSDGRILTAALPTASPGDQTRLPTVLSQADVERYRRIFELGEPGRWDEVDRLIGELENPLLLGHVLAQRYLHPTKYRTPFHELQAWMARFHDLPQAPRMYKLAKMRRPKGESIHRATYRLADLSGVGAGASRERYVSPRPRSSDERHKVSRLLRQVHWNVLKTRLTITQELLDQDKVRTLLDTAERDGALAQVAAGWFYYGRSDKAYALAGPAAKRSGELEPLAHWIAGLSAWKQDKIAEAVPHFRALARARRASPWIRSAGAYWAARGLLRLKQPAASSQWLREAAAYPRTFYGLIAHAALGIPPRLDFRAQPVGAKTTGEVVSKPAVQRAIALLQVGLRERAERELLGVAAWSDPESAAALLVLAERGGLVGLAYRLGHRLANAPDNGWPEAAVNAALYPIPPWEPATGFRIDRALLFAFMRQESGFNPDAKSGAGARGLLQLMPATASYMARRENFSYSGRSELFRPALNLDLGQRYLGYLSDYDWVEDNLFNLAAAYNGGPGNLAKWQRKTATDDPLLFIESLPSRETRLFIERVLTNLWIYRHRLDQPAPSLQAIAAGAWPRYESLDANPQVGGPREVAQR